MKWIKRLLIRMLPAAILVTGCGDSPTTAREAGRTLPPERPEAAAPKETVVRVPPAQFGEIFPSYVYANLNPAPGGKGSVNLGEFLGKRPIVFCYWIAGRSRGERIFQDLQRLADEAGPGKLALFGIVREKPGVDAAKIGDRIRDLGIRVPVLNDEEFRLGQHLAVRTVPSVSVIDAEGRLRLGNASSLRQVLEYNLDVEAAIRRVAAKGTLGTYGNLPRYDPVNELIGKKSPDFEATVVGDGTSRRWSSVLDPKRINVLVFWSVDCPHCKRALPQINDWLKQHPDGVNFASAAAAQDEASRQKTEDYCRVNQFSFPTFLDRGLQIAELYEVSATPTMLIIRPDGVVDSVFFGEIDFPKALDAKQKEILGSSKS